MTKQIDYARITAGRMVRNELAALRLELGIKYQGLFYIPTEWHTEPRKIYVDKVGAQYLEQDGKYVRLPVKV